MTCIHIGWVIVIALVALGLGLAAGFVLAHTAKRGE